MNRSLAAFFALTLLVVLDGSALGQVSPDSLRQRGDKYFETAIAIVQEVPEVIEAKGSKYLVLLQDLQTKKIVPRTKSLFATGFFLFHRGHYFFATASHVRHKLNANTRLAYRAPGGKARVFLLGKLVAASDKLGWLDHPETDVSLLPLQLSPEGEKEVAELALLSTDLAKTAPKRTAKLIVAGFPGGLGTMGNEISPVTAVVHLASEEIMLGAVVGGKSINRAYLFNPPAGSGYSGAPIFYEDENNERFCIGMLIGAWSDPTGGKFGISVPAHYILDFADQSIDEMTPVTGEGSDDSPSSVTADTTKDVAEQPTAPVDPPEMRERSDKKQQDPVPQARGLDSVPRKSIDR